MIDIREVDNRFVIIEDNFTHIQLRYLWQEIVEIKMYGVIIIFGDDYRVEAEFIKDEFRYLFNTNKFKYYISKVRIRKSLISDMIFPQLDGVFKKPKRPFKLISTEVILKINKIYFDNEGNICLMLEMVI